MKTTSKVAWDTFYEYLSSKDKLRHQTFFAFLPLSQKTTVGHLISVLNFPDSSLMHLMSHFFVWADASFMCCSVCKSTQQEAGDGRHMQATCSLNFIVTLRLFSVCFLTTAAQLAFNVVQWPPLKKRLSKCSLFTVQKVSLARSYDTPTHQVAHTQHS